MKVKTSITLSGEVLDRIDERQAEFRRRSEFLERAARAYLTQLVKNGS